MKNIDGNVSKKYRYFFRIDTYCKINYDIKYVFTLKAVLLIKAFLMKVFSYGQKWDFIKVFFYDVTIFKYDVTIFK